MVISVVYFGTGLKNMFRVGTSILKYLYECNTCWYVRLNAKNVPHVSWPCFIAPSLLRCQITLNQFWSKLMVTFLWKLFHYQILNPLFNCWILKYTSNFYWVLISMHGDMYGLLVLSKKWLKMDLWALSSWLPHWHVAALWYWELCVLLLYSLKVPLP